MKTSSMVGMLVAAGLVAAPGAWAEVDGAAVFTKNCGVCHGESGAADTPAAKSMKLKPFKGNAEVASASVDDLVGKIKANPKHAGLVKKLSDEELTAAAAHAQSLAK